MHIYIRGIYSYPYTCRKYERAYILYKRYKLITCVINNIIKLYVTNKHYSLLANLKHILSHLTYI